MGVLYEILSYLQFASESIDVPFVFQNCSSIFRLKDVKYVECVPEIPAGDTPCELLKELHRAKDFRTYFLAIIPVVLSVIALILNIVYLTLQVMAYLRESVGYRKRYVFVISRSLSSIMALLLLYVVIIVWKAQGFLYSSVMIFIFVGSLDFLSITGTYVALTLLLYTAITRPIFYKTILRLRHCFMGIGVIWIVSIGVSICVGLWGATLFYPNSAPVSCSFSSCQRPLSIVLLVLLCISYLTVLTLYTFLLLRMNRRAKTQRTEQRLSSSGGTYTSSVTAMNRLSMNMGTFAIGSIPMVIVLIVAIANLHELSSLGEGDKSPCKTFLNSQLFVQVEILGSCAAVIWLLGMIMDPVINFASDPKLMRLGRRFIERFIKTEEKEKHEIEMEDSSH